MAGIICNFDYPGVTNQSLISASFTYTHGISPSVCEIVTATQPNPQQNGTLVLRQDGRVIDTFPNCRVDTVDIERAANGDILYRTRIMDRRWLWRECYQVSGFYNTRWDQDEIRPGTEQTLSQLAVLCLKAMGEEKYDVTALKEVAVLPEVTWEFDSPAEMLARLCEIAKCYICLQNNKVVICKIGQGAQLDTYPATDGSISVNPPDPPSKLVIVCGRNRYQHDFELEAVGLEADGRIVPLDDLSYIPKDNRGRPDWSKCENFKFSAISDKNFRSLAMMSVWKYYRIKTPFILPSGDKVGDLNLILPLENTQIENVTHTFPGNGKKQLVPLPPWVYGEFYAGNHSLTVEESNPLFDPAKKPRGFYRYGFSIQPELGLVKFANPMFQYRTTDDDVLGKRIFPAKLFLRIACGLRNPDSLEWKRNQVYRTLDSKRKDAPKYVKKDDLINEIFLTSAQPRQLKNNSEKIRTQANLYLDALVAEYQTRQSGSITYVGFMPLKLDGAIQQITWMLTSNGDPFTRVSRNKEEVYVTATYAERRIFESIVASNGKLTQADRLRLVDERRKAQA